MAKFYSQSLTINLVISLLYNKTLDIPIMALSKTKCLILASNTEAIYLDDQSGIRK